MIKPRVAGGVVLGIAIGTAIGVGSYTFVYARGYSYMTDNAEACVNCHVMQDQFSGWLKSSHRSVAVCNDCHTPPGFVAKYATKARNGFWHSYYFTTGWFDDNIHITPKGREVTEQACRKCHQDIVQAIEGAHSEREDARTSCIRCHDSVGPQADPRSVVAQSRLEEDPRLKTMWAGYAFAKDFREERGHAYMLDDQTFTERQQVTQQPGTCINCHASVYVAYKQLGGGDIFKGFETLNKTPYFEARKFVTHPVACIDCHDLQTMQLRVTRPAFEGMRALKASQGIQNYHVNKQATRQKMRAFVCGQCHDECHFSGPEKRLVYPWAKGLLVENILAFYDEQKFKDWEHAGTGAPVLKAQHPEFEMWNQGIHARSGVACADCHMPYKREGALKISDHHVRSPLLNINRACQTCHKWSEEELKARVETIQTRTQNLRNLAMDALVDLINDIKAARGGGRNDGAVTTAQDFQRRAQFYVDFIESENSTGFHAPQEAARILGESINFSRKGQIALRGGSQSGSAQSK